MAEIETCANCRHYDPAAKECRVRAPQVFVCHNMVQTTVWPKVEPEQHCGEWKSKAQ